MHELKATVSLSLVMREGETKEEAENRLYDLLYGELCTLADHHIDFWIESTRKE